MRFRGSNHQNSRGLRQMIKNIQIRYPRRQLAYRVGECVLFYERGYPVTTRGVVLEETGAHKMYFQTLRNLGSAPRQNSDRSEEPIQNIIRPGQQSARIHQMKISVVRIKEGCWPRSSTYCLNIFFTPAVRHFSSNSLSMQSRISP